MPARESAEVKAAVDAHLNGLTRAAAATQFGVSESSMNRYMHRHNLPLQGQPRKASAPAPQSTLEQPRSASSEPAVPRRSSARTGAASPRRA
jgi:transposase